MIKRNMINIFDFFIIWHFQNMIKKLPMGYGEVGIVGGGEFLGDYGEGSLDYAELCLVGHDWAWQSWACGRLQLAVLS